MLSQIKTATYITILSCITLLLISCSKEVTVKPEIRAVERWTALINEDWAKAYSFQTPNYRKTYTLKAYRNSFGRAVSWQSIELISSKPVSDTITDVKLKLEISFAEGGANLIIPSFLNERWQLIDNQWWYVKK